MSIAKGQTQDFAGAALALARDLGIQPSPPIYEVLYHVVSNDMPKLHVSFTALRDSGAIIDEKRCLDLHTEFFGDKDTADLVESLGLQMESKVSDAIRSIGDAGGEAESFTGTLADFSKELKGAGKLGQALGALVDRLVRTTSATAATVRRLEKELQATSTELTTLRQNLTGAINEAKTDELTQIGNRRAFNDYLTTAIQESRGEHHSLALVIVDLDHFKKFNDTWGHQLGDQVLRLIARSLADHVGDTGFAARFGGEEFAVILPKYTSVQAHSLAERVNKYIGGKRIRHRGTGENVGKVTMSCGVSVLRKEDSFDSLIARADEAMYAAKTAGRNRVVSKD